LKTANKQTNNNNKRKNKSAFEIRPKILFTRKTFLNAMQIKKV